MEKGRQVPGFLHNYGTTEADQLADYAQWVIGAFDAGNADEYSSAEEAFAKVYEGISAELRQAIEYARDNNQWTSWHGEVGTASTCDAYVTAIVRAHDFELAVSLSGGATFRYTAVSDPSEPIAWAELEPVDLGHSNGDIILQADPDRATISRIEATQDGSLFPARSTLRFYATASIPSLGENYRSINEIVIENPGLTSWPHQDTRYLQVGTTEFENIERPGEVALVLSNAQVTVSAQHR